MKRKIPSRIKIGRRVYQIKLNTESDSVDNNLGSILYRYNIISLKEAGRSMEEIKISLLHEMFHAFFYFSGHWGLDDSEGIINMLAENLYQVIEDNPEVIEWLKNVK